MQHPHTESAIGRREEVRRRSSQAVAACARMKKWGRVSEAACRRGSRTQRRWCRRCFARKTRSSPAVNLVCDLPALNYRPRFSGRFTAFAKTAASFPGDMQSQGDANTGALLW